jgi:hypothetical protein
VVVGLATGSWAASTSAGPTNWTNSYASFTEEHFEMPVGVQATVESSDDDFLVALRDRLRDDTALRTPVRPDQAASGS